MLSHVGKHWECLEEMTWKEKVGGSDEEMVRRNGLVEESKWHGASRNNNLLIDIGIHPQKHKIMSF